MENIKLINKSKIAKVIPVTDEVASQYTYFKPIKLFGKIIFGGDWYKFGYGWVTREYIEKRDYLEIRNNVVYYKPHLTIVSSAEIPDSYIWFDKESTMIDYLICKKHPFSDFLILNGEVVTRDNWRFLID